MPLLFHRKYTKIFLQNAILTPDKELNLLTYGTLLYVIIITEELETFWPVFIHPLVVSCNYTVNHKKKVAVHL